MNPDHVIVATNDLIHKSVHTLLFQAKDAIQISLDEKYLGIRAKLFVVANNLDKVSSDHTIEWLQRAYIQGAMDVKNGNLPKPDNSIKEI